VPFEHGTDAMAAGVKQPLTQLRPFLSEAFNGFECLSLQLLAREDEKLVEMKIVSRSVSKSPKGSE